MAIRSIEKHRFLGTLAIVSMVIAFSSMQAIAASDDMIRVFMDHARIIKLDRPISKVIIGSSEVADVTVADSNTIVLTGKSYGTTNLVILDGDGQAIIDELILVSVDEANTLRIYKQTERSVYSCSPSCEQHVKSGSGAATATP